MIEISKIIEQLDIITYRHTAIVRIHSPYYVTLCNAVIAAGAKYFMRYIVHVDAEDWFLVAIEKGANIRELEVAFSAAAPYISDISIL